MEAKKVRGAVRGASTAQVLDAERSFKVWLRGRFSAVWIAENARDLMNQANLEYAEWLQDHPPARNPAAWLHVCAERRAKNLLDKQTRRPPTTPLEEVFHLRDESSPAPEQQVLERDRRDRLRDALDFLPEKECRLLALVYYEDHSVSEAGRRLGWQKSAAARHHERALKKLRALVGDDRSLLSPATVGLVAWQLAYGDRGRWSRWLDAATTPAREGLALGLEGGEWIGRQSGELWRRLSPVSEQAGAAATGGGGRLVGACGVAVASVICGIAAGVVPSGSGTALSPARPAGGPVPPGQGRAPTAPTLSLPTLPPPEPAPDLLQPDSRSSTAKPTVQKTTPIARPKARGQSRADTPTATPEQVESEFGLESGPAPAPEPAATPTPAAPPSPSTTAPRPESPGGSSGSQTAREFGL